MEKNKDIITREGKKIMADVKFEIQQEIGTISESSKGWKKELNVVSWNGDIAKYDLREWAPDHQKMGKGLTFTKEELVKLRDMLDQMDV